MVSKTYKGLSVLARPALFAAFVLIVTAGRASAVQTPEIDPGSMGSAVALVSAGFCLLAARRSK